MNWHFFGRFISCSVHTERMVKFILVKIIKLILIILKSINIRQKNRELSRILRELGINIYQLQY